MCTKLQLQNVVGKDYTKEQDVDRKITLKLILMK
jgi:hypothetical protein